LISYKGELFGLLLNPLRVLHPFILVIYAHVDYLNLLLISL
jgi:hypothetical protein